MLQSGGLTETWSQSSGVTPRSNDSQVRLFSENLRTGCFSLLPAVAASMLLSYASLTSYSMIPASAFIDFLPYAVQSSSCKDISYKDAGFTLI